jgi:hypothetical protein
MEVFLLRWLSVVFDPARSSAFPIPGGLGIGKQAITYRIRYPGGGGYSAMRYPWMIVDR